MSKEIIYSASAPEPIECVPILWKPVICCLCRGKIAINRCHAVLLSMYQSRMKPIRSWLISRFIFKTSGKQFRQSCKSVSIFLNMNNFQWWMTYGKYLRILLLVKPLRVSRLPKMWMLKLVVSFIIWWIQFEFWFAPSPTAMAAPYWQRAHSSL